MTITSCMAKDLADWDKLRRALWPDAGAEELPALLADPDAASFIARAPDGAAIGFVEAMVRHDYVNGCETSPVAFVEGLYVVEAWRRQGVARALVAKVGDWAKARGLTELASDALLENERSHTTHRALSFAETERVVYFRRAMN